MSKFSRSTMEKSVYGPLSRQAGDPSVLLGSLFGEDIALVDTGSGLVASHVDPIVGASEGDIAEARSLADKLSVVEEALKLASLGATAMHDPTRGGVLEAMCEMAQGAGMSFRIDGDALPISETVDRFSRAFDFDPMRMISSGALVVTLPGEAVERSGAELGSIAPLYPVGVVERGTGVTITSSSGDLFYEGPEPDFDELARLQAYLSCEKRQKLVH